MLINPVPPKLIRPERSLGTNTIPTSDKLINICHDWTRIAIKLASLKRPPHLLTNIQSTLPSANNKPGEGSKYFGVVLLIEDPERLTDTVLNLNK